MRRIVAPAFVIGIVCRSVLALGAAPAELVGDYGNPARLLITGNRQFTAAAIVRAVSADLEISDAAHRFAPLDAYLKILAEQTRYGYRRSGFAEAQVEALLRPEQKQIELRIQEGRRYHCGEVRIQNAATLDQTEVRRWLTEPYPEDKSVVLDPMGRADSPRQWLKKDGETAKQKEPLWKKGEVAAFDAEHLRRIKSNVERACREAGHDAAKVAVEYKLQQETADLVVQIDEGPQLVIAEIEIRGQKKNAGDDVIKHAGLKVGRAFNRAEQTRIERALWSSARFCSYTVKCVPTEQARDGTQPGKLSVELVELASAPRLTDPLSPIETALLKAVEWLAGCRARGDEFLFEVESDGGARWQVASTAVGLVAYGVVPGGEKHPQPYRYAALITDRQVCLTAGDRRTKCDLPTTNFGVIGSTKFSVDNSEKPMKMLFGFGARTSKSQRRTVTFEKSLPPAVMLSFAHGEEREHPVYCHLDKGILSVVSSGYRFEIAAETGALHEVRVLDDEEYRVRVTVVRGKFAELRRQAESLADGCRNVYDPQAPAISILQFLIDEKWDDVLPDDLWNDQTAALAGLLRKFIQADVTSPIVHDLLASMAESIDTFAIPVRDWRVGQGDAPVTWVSTAAAMIPYLNDSSFPRDSWAWTLNREISLAAIGRTRYVGDELKHAVDAGRWGPLACWFTSLAARTWKIDEIETLAAAQALRQMSADDFRRDCATALDAEHTAGKVCRRLAVFVRSLNDSETLLLQSLAAEYVPWTEPMITSLHADAERPLDESLVRALERFWKTGLERRIAERFEPPQKK